MFSGIGLSEILLVMLIALLVMGPEKLPEVARKLGKGVREVRRATSMFSDMFMLDEELDRAGRQQPAGADASGSPGAVAGALSGSVARGGRKFAPSRPVLLSDVRRPTHIRQVPLAAAKPPPVASPENIAAVENNCIYEALPAARRMDI